MTWVMYIKLQSRSWNLSLPSLSAENNEVYCFFHIYIFICIKDASSRLKGKYFKKKGRKIKEQKNKWLPSLEKGKNIKMNV